MYKVVKYIKVVKTCMYVLDITTITQTLFATIDTGV